MDKILEDGRFEIEGLTGTSAGGMNAVAVAQGLAKGGNQEARATLKLFWDGVWLSIAIFFNLPVKLEFEIAQE